MFTDDAAREILERMEDVESNPDERIIVGEPVEGAGGYYFDSDACLYSVADATGEGEYKGQISEEAFEHRTRHASGL